jgi:aspartyl aminopeptidase
MSAQDFCDFLNEGKWSPYHAVAAVCKRLLAAGFVEIRETDSWELKPSGKYFFTRNYSTIVAFAVGSKYLPSNGVSIIGCHTDSPCPMLKPVSKVIKSGYPGLGVQTYGGGLWHTWFDRDLGVAGRAIVRRDGKPTHELVKISRAIMKIPNLAIHLQTADERASFKVNKQSHLVPILASAISSQLELDETKDDGAKSNHAPKLIKLLAAELKCKPEDIAELELCMCDTQPAAIFGIDADFISSGRLDNLNSVYCATQALVNASTDESLLNERNVRCVAFFDHEEVGSCSAVGAGSTVMTEALRRITTSLGAAAGDTSSDLVERALRKSFMVSADMAHALHPNYPEKHESEHQPKLNGGVVIKTNANQRYASNSVTSFLFKELGERAGLPVQEFVVRNDSGCGSTIGPLLSTLTGVRTVDVGASQWAMHSIRETCGTKVS